MYRLLSILLIFVALVGTAEENPYGDFDYKNRASFPAWGVGRPSEQSDADPVTGAPDKLWRKAAPPTQPKIQKVIAKLSSRDFHEREQGSKELLANLAEGGLADRRAFLEAAIFTEKTGQPEAARRARRAITGAGLTLNSIDWLKFYCQYAEKKAGQLRPASDLSNKVALVVGDESLYKDLAELDRQANEIFPYLDAISSWERVAKERKLKVPKDLQADDKELKEAADALKQNQAGLEAVETNHKEKIDVAGDFNRTLAKNLGKLGFEVDPTLVVRVDQAFAVRGTYDKKNYIIQARRHFGAFNVNVYPDPLPPREKIEWKDFVDPLLLERFDFSSLPGMEVPGFGVGATVQKGPKAIEVVGKGLAPFWKGVRITGNESTESRFVRFFSFTDRQLNPHSAPENSRLFIENINIDKLQSLDPFMVRWGEDKVNRKLPCGEFSLPKPVAIKPAGKAPLPPKGIPTPPPTDH